MARQHHQRARAQERSRRARLRVAREAARLISEDGIRDYRHAKDKAARQLGIVDAQNLPRNDELEQALREHQQLFHHNEHADVLRRLREAACDALEFFRPFHARLVGPVLSGTADRHSAVCLHLFSDPLENIHAFLDEQGIPFDETTRRMRTRRDRHEEVPVLQLMAEDTRFDLTLLPLVSRRQAPLGKIGDKPMPRASLRAVRMLLQAQAADAGC